MNICKWNLTGEPEPFFPIFMTDINEQIYAQSSMRIVEILLGNGALRVSWWLPCSVCTNHRPITPRVACAVQQETFVQR